MSTAWFLAVFGESEAMDETPNSKLQTSNTKHQTPRKLQNPGCKHAYSEGEGGERATFRRPRLLIEMVTFYGK